MLFLQCFSSSAVESRVFILSYNISQRVTWFQFDTLCCCQSGHPHYDYSLSVRSNLIYPVWLSTTRRKRFSVSLLPSIWSLTRTFWNGLLKKLEFLYQLLQRHALLFQSQVRWKLVMTELRFGGYSIEWQLAGLRQVLDTQWMEPVWAAHYRGTSAAVRPPLLQTPPLALHWCFDALSMCVCERPAAEQNHTHAPTLTNTHLPPTVAGCLRIKI